MTGAAALTWVDYAESRRAGFEWLGLRPPPIQLGLSLLPVPAPKVVHCRIPAPLRVNYPGRGTTRSKSIGVRRLTVFEQRTLASDVADLERAGIYDARPRVFGDCPPVDEPCGFVSCRHHLGLDIDEGSGAVKITHPVADTHPERAHLLRQLTPVEAELFRLFEHEGLSIAEASGRMDLPERRLAKVRDLTRRKLAASPELDILSMRETCSLRAAQKAGATGMTEEAIGDLMGGLCGPAVGRILKKAIAKFKAGMAEAMRQEDDDFDDEPG